MQKPAVTAQTLSDAQMTEIMNGLLAEKARLSMTSKCVKVRKTNDSNVENAFAIVNQLKSKGFIISGREVTGKPVKRYTISSTGDCLVVTIGTF